MAVAEIDLYRTGVIIPQDYREFFVATAGASGALIGLLFVAVSIFHEQSRQAATRAEYHARASGASNALVLSLAALVPEVALGWWAVVIGVGVLAFSAATTRSIIAAARKGLGHWGSLRLVIAILAIAGFELYAGVRLIVDHSDQPAIQILDYVVIGDLAAGIARAWQLVNMRKAGLISSLRVLTLGDNDGESDQVTDRPS